MNPAVVGILILLLVIVGGVIIWFVTRETKKEGDDCTGLDLNASYKLDEDLECRFVQCRPGFEINAQGACVFIVEEKAKTTLEIANEELALARIAADAAVVAAEAAAEADKAEAEAARDVALKELEEAEARQAAAALALQVAEAEKLASEAEAEAAAADALTQAAELEAEKAAAETQLLLQQQLTAAQQAQYQIVYDDFAGFVNQVYPSGCIIKTTNDVNPSVALNAVPGVTTIWKKFGEGRILVGQGSVTDTRNVTTMFNVGDQGGSTDVTLTKGQIAPHDHNMRRFPGYAGGPGTWSSYFPENSVGCDSGDFCGGKVRDGVTYANLPYARGQQLSDDADADYYKATGLGGGQADGTTAPHDNMPPYITVYFWERTDGGGIAEVA
jgi:hypothetical protein